jgi:hypothetical protein
MINRLAGMAVVLLLAPLVLALPASAGMTTCRLAYQISGWSFLYKNYTGSGTVSCENGQTARVAIETHGGGFTAGKSEIAGRGRFTQVRGINEVYGVYVEAGDHAGLTRSADGRVLTRGEVSIALAGTGRGVDLGIAFGAFRITRQ